MQAKRWSVARQLLALQTLLLLAVFAVAATTTLVVDRNNNQSAARAKVLALAQSIAANPFVVQQSGASDPSRALEPYAEQIRLETHVDFVVIMAPDRTRWTHPTRSQIGKPFIGTIQPALQGHAFTETNTGTLGRSVRAVAPVRDPRGKVVALVSDGITTEAIRAQLVRQLPILLTALGLLLAVALAGAVLVSRRLRRQTRGLDANTIARMVASHEAVLHSIREGLVVTDTAGRIGLMNDEARRLLNTDGDLVGHRVETLAVASSIKELLAEARTADDELHLAGERVLVVNQLPAQWEGHRYGTVTTLRDRTELESLTGELNTTKALAESLRSQAHETANRLHTMIVLVETGRGDDAIRYATKQLELSQRLTDRLFETIDEPVLAALLLGKTAQAAERGVELTVDVRGTVTLADLPASDLVTVVGNLVDNAIDASAQSQPDRWVHVAIGTDNPLGTERAELLVEVADSGPGLAEDLVDLAFTRGWSTKVSPTTAGRGLGLALVHQVVDRHRGSVTVAPSDAGGACFRVRLPLPAGAPLP